MKRISPKEEPKQNNQQVVLRPSIKVPPSRVDMSAVAEAIKSINMKEPIVNVEVNVPPIDIPTIQTAKGTRVLEVEVTRRDSRGNIQAMRITERGSLT